MINDLVHDFINFNALKIILKIHKKIIKKDPGLTLTQGNLLVTYVVHIVVGREKLLIGSAASRTHSLLITHRYKHKSSSLSS